jgi:hypothetical protein
MANGFGKNKDYLSIINYLAGASREEVISNLIKLGMVE